MISQNQPGRQPSIRCPVCEAVVNPALTLAMPFCSERCRQIDLGRWLAEDYGLPIEPELEEDFDAGDES